MVLFRHLRQQSRQQKISLKRSLSLYLEPSARFSRCKASCSTSTMAMIREPKAIDPRCLVAIRHDEPISSETPQSHPLQIEKQPELPGTFSVMYHPAVAPAMVAHSHALTKFSVH